MAKDVNDHSNEEEEFEFLEEGEESHQQSAADEHRPAPTISTPGSDGGANKRKKILVIVGIIVAAFCVYKLYGLFTATSARAIKSAPLAGVKFEENKSAAPETKPETSMQLPQKTEEQPAEQKEAIKLPEFTNGNTTENNPTTKPSTSQNNTTPTPTPNSVSEGNNSANIPANGVSSESASNLEKSQANLQTQISGLSSAITGIQNNISMLTQQVGQIVSNKNTPTKPTAQPENKSNAVPPEKKSETSNNVTEKSTEKNCEEKNEHYSRAVYHPRAHRIYYGLRTRRHYREMGPRVYYIRSLVQNRAWLIYGNDRTLTVSPGDMLPGYGKILDVDTDDGLVHTSSGKDITYMPQDR